MTTLFVRWFDDWPEENAVAKKSGNANKPKDFEALRKELVRRGYHLERRQHVHVYRPNGSFLMAYAGSPSDHRAARNTWRSFLKATENEA